jgi:transcriptional regulator
MAKTELQGSLDLLVLKVLAGRAPLHGYAIISAIKEVSDEVLCVEEGSLYPALHRMEGAGLIRAKWMAKGPGRRVRIYDLTARGREQLATEEVRWTAVADAVRRVLKFA